MQEVEVMGIRFQNVTMPEAIDDLLKLARSERTSYVVTPNPEIAEACRKNPELFKAVNEADYVIPDGIGIVIASRICGSPLKERVAGYDLACAILPGLAQKGLSLYLLGGKPGVAEAAAENLKAKVPSLRIAGTHDGYFEDDGPVVEEINRTGANVVFVALGFPKQEVWMHRNRGSLNASLMMGLGGSLDILAGVASRAPDFFIRLNLEWFYRLLKQPSRFIRMLSLPRYFLRACASRLLSDGGK